jgi:hypothetical protein
MNMNQYKSLKVGDRVLRSSLTFPGFEPKTEHGAVVAVYNGNYQVKVLFDGSDKAVVVGYSQIEIQ